MTYCLHPLIGDDQSYEYDDDDTDSALTDPSLLMDSNYESINWYPLTGLLAVPVFVGIVCFVVLRRRFVLTIDSKIIETEVLTSFKVTV